MEELKIEQVRDELAKIPVQKGGYTDWMFNYWFEPQLSTLQERLDIIGVRIAFVKKEKE